MAKAEVREAAKAETETTTISMQTMHSAKITIYNVYQFQ